MTLREIAQRARVNAALKLLDRCVLRGRLDLTTPDGRRYSFAGKLEGPHCDIVVRDWRALDAVMRRADIGLGEGYAAAWWDTPDLVSLCSFAVVNSEHLDRLGQGSAIFQMLAAIRNTVIRRNSVRGSKANIIAHYDLGNNFYKLWLDETLSYSSALYVGKNDSLAEAQRSKYQRILDIAGPKGTILEIGCGWGGFLEAAANRNERVTGVTISPEQYQIAKTRAPGNSDVHLVDYRACSGRYQTIVSIEMFEAVGERYWPAYFAVLRERLADNGAAIVQTISIRNDLFDTYRRTSDYIRAHVFPGGMLPSLQRFREEGHRAGLECFDVFSFGADYARTLREWLVRFDAARQDVRDLGFSEAFVRGWRFYLALCAAAFENGRTDVHQIALRKA